WPLKIAVHTLFLRFFRFLQLLARNRLSAENYRDGWLVVDCRLVREGVFKRVVFLLQHQRALGCLSCLSLREARHDAHDGYDQNQTEFLGHTECSMLGVGCCSNADMSPENRESTKHVCLSTLNHELSTPFRRPFHARQFLWQ